ncbi:MAG: ATP-binding protein [Thermoleophilia bacterium]|nr:ATP-binding protein [Thermoleophilia bacterium]
MPERRPRTANTELVRLLPAEGDALAGARAMVEEVEGLSRAARDDIALLVTELVGNSLRHAGLGPDDRIRIRIARQRGSVRVEVTDPGPGFSPMRERPGRRQTSGRGIYLVEQVADRWGLERTGETCVWFELWIGDSRTRHRLRAPDHLLAPADLASLSESQLKESLGVLTHDERTVSAERNTLHERIAEVRRELEHRGVPGHQA